MAAAVTPEQVHRPGAERVDERLHVLHVLVDGEIVAYAVPALGPAGAADPGIAATMTGMEGITFVLAAALAIGTIALRGYVSPVAAVALLTVAALGFLLGLLHWGRWLPW